MDRNQVLREILADKELCEKYKIKDVSSLNSNPPYNNKLVEVLSVIINENDNNLSDTQIYKKIKNIHNIG
jgi:hypothetical protein